MRISVFDMLKIGVGPSSSHTLGPWVAALRWLNELKEKSLLTKVTRVQVTLYGSLAMTGHGHYTGAAIILGLSAEDYETIDTSIIDEKLDVVRKAGELQLADEHTVIFDDKSIHFAYGEMLPFHANGLCFEAQGSEGTLDRSVYYSTGGGFVVKEGEVGGTASVELPYPCDCSEDLINHCRQDKLSIAQMVWRNENTWRSNDDIRQRMLKIWHVMRDGVYQGCHTEGILPGGLKVKRRAADLSKKLFSNATYASKEDWFTALDEQTFSFQQVLKWVSCFALAVNEENASLGRVVTAPTNGAAGVIPAVLMYYRYLCQEKVDDDTVIDFLLVAGELGSFFKKGATISAAMGGCQAEIGVSSAMAAGALTEALGGTVEQSLMASEIAMEHHLGLTCDPVGGLVQVPCIERNAMGAVKAITAANIALESDPASAKVSLDKVIQTMWETAQDMNHKYKETSQAGLAQQISVGLPEC